MKTLSKMVVIGVVVALLAALVPQMVGAAVSPKSWYLTGADFTAENPPVPCLVMDKTAPTDTKPANIGFDLKKGEVSHTWLSDVPAENNVSYSVADPWTLYLKTGSSWENNDDIIYMDVQLGYWDPLHTSVNNGFKFFNSTIVKASETNGYMVTITMNQPQDVTIPEGCYMALIITNTGATGGDVKILTGKDDLSYINPPEDGPDFPLPEIASFILFGVGAIVLIGFIYTRRRKASV